MQYRLALAAQRHTKAGGNHAAYQPDFLRPPLPSVGPPCSWQATTPPPSLQPRLCPGRQEYGRQIATTVHFQPLGGSWHCQGLRQHMRHQAPQRPPARLFRLPAPPQAHQLFRPREGPFPPPATACHLPNCAASVSSALRIFRRSSLPPRQTGTTRPRARRIRFPSGKPHAVRSCHSPSDQPRPKACASCSVRPRLFSSCKASGLPRDCRARSRNIRACSCHAGDGRRSHAGDAADFFSCLAKGLSLGAGAMPRASHAAQ